MVDVITVYGGPTCSLCGGRGWMAGRQGAPIECPPCAQLLHVAVSMRAQWEGSHEGNNITRRAQSLLEEPNDHAMAEWERKLIEEPQTDNGKVSVLVWAWIGQLCRVEAEAFLVGFHADELASLVPSDPVPIPAEALPLPPPLPPMPVTTVEPGHVASVILTGLGNEIEVTVHLDNGEEVKVHAETGDLEYWEVGVAVRVRLLSGEATSVWRV